MKWSLPHARLGVCAVVACFAAAAQGAFPVVLDLNGRWALRADGDTVDIPATVPGTVHQDLQAAGKIPDPFFGNNALDIKWVPEKTWIYSRTFDAPADLLKNKHVVLRCEGLDTIATVTLNDKELGTADNMFRTWEFDVRDDLQAGANKITIRFKPFKAYINEFVEAAKGKGPNTSYPGISNVRKALYSNGWDFGPQLPATGIYRNIQIVGYDEARLTGVLTQTQVEPGKPAVVTLKPQLADAVGDGLKVRATMTLAGKPVATVTGPATSPIELKVTDPKLWWPNNMGDHPLYDIVVDVLDRSGAVADSRTQRVGLRKIELIRPDPGFHAVKGPFAEGAKPLRLRVNGREIFSRGASWIPADMFLPRTTPGHIRNLLTQARDANFNFVRSWGGGYYEEQAFFDTCDELGLMVWTDFKFACNGYPGKNPAFADNVRNEVAEQVTRLSPHPSIAVWCGNNEIEAIVNNYKVMSQEQYDLLFRDLIGGTVKKLLPTVEYVTGSPDEGDEHNWWVWHVGANFEKYRESHGWMTEFGFQSFPLPGTVNSFTAPEDRDSVQSKVMNSHQHNRRGNEIITNQIARYFNTPKDFESMLWLSQINQAYGLLIGIEHWRSEWPKSSGAFIWQLDDCWPGTSWSIVDYYARPKAAMYSVKAGYAPVMVTGVYEPKEAVLPLIVCSDLAESFKADVKWKVTDTDGKLLASGTNAVAVPAGAVAAAGPKLNLKEAVAKSGRKNLIVWVDVLREGKSVASNVLLPSRPKDMPLQNPQLSSDVVAAGDGFDVTIKAAKPALWTWADLPGDPDAKWSNNFVHVAADKPLTLHVKPSKSIDLGELKKTLVVRSLFDTAAPKPPAEAKLVKPAGDGALVAGAQFAEISGDSARLEEGNPPDIGAWSNADDELQWTLDVPKPGVYNVVAELSCPRGTEGSRIEVSSGASKAAFVVPATSNWGDYKTVKVGVMRFDSAGTTSLKLRVLNKPKSNVMNLRSLTLSPNP